MWIIYEIYAQLLSPLANKSIVALTVMSGVPEADQLDHRNVPRYITVPFIGKVNPIIKALVLRLSKT